MSVPVHFLVAAGERGEIGAQGSVPWPRIDADMRHFVKTSSRTNDPRKCNAVVMGRKTWDSIPAARRPLPNRLNIVLSRQAPAVCPELSLRRSNVAAAPIFLPSVEALWPLVERLSALVEAVVVIGGSAAFQAVLDTGEGRRRLGRLYLTRVHARFPDADTFIDVDQFAQLFPVVDKSKTLTDTASTLSIDVICRRTSFEDDLSFDQSSTSQSSQSSQLSQSNQSSQSSQLSQLSQLSQSSQTNQSTSIHEEYQYLQLIRDIIETGVRRDDRTGVGTLALFGKQMKFSLRDGRFPLLTTKSTFFRGIVEELLWFIKGSTDARQLAARKVHIWDANGSRAFLDSRGLTERDEGDLGPVYGFQWRHFGARYVDMHSDYSGQGVDQLADCIDKIRRNPTDRRIVMSAWNPADLHLMALPPCHMFCQFFVADGELSCLMYQRSCDMGLGVPFNIASYALLTRLVAHVCDLRPGDFIHCLGDTHVYLNHLEPLREQLARTPYPFPTLHLDPAVKNIDDFTAEHITLRDYRSHPKIAMPMAL